MSTPLRHVKVTRYVTPLREGGSLPAIAEADDEFLYVLKFRGSGQGVKKLIAELIGGEVARAMRWVPPHPGMIPRFTSGRPNRARSEARRMSQARASSQPPPSA